MLTKAHYQKGYVDRKRAQGFVFTSFMIHTSQLEEIKAAIKAKNKSIQAKLALGLPLDGTIRKEAQ
jgi:hypothetical protein